MLAFIAPLWKTTEMHITIESFLFQVHFSFLYYFTETELVPFFLILKSCLFYPAVFVFIDVL